MNLYSFTFELKHSRKNLIMFTWALSDKEAELVNLGAVRITKIRYNVPLQEIYQINKEYNYYRWV